MRTICICLPEREAESSAAEAHFKESGVENLEFVWGLDANVSGLDSSHVYEVDAPKSGFRMGAKPVGIWLAHWTCWQIIMRYTEDRFLILETDAQFLPGWKDKLNEALKIVPTNFDFLHIGHCCMEGHPRTWVAGEVWESKHAQCTHAYIVRRAAIPFLLMTLRKIWAPIDIQMQLECFPHLKTFAIMPRIVSQFNTIIPP